MMLAFLGTGPLVVIAGVRMFFRRAAALKRMVQLAGAVVGFHRERRVISTGSRQQDPMLTVTVIVPEIEIMTPAGERTVFRSETGHVDTTPFKIGQTLQVLWDPE
jgi:hypothetical protein